MNMMRRIIYIALSLVQLGLAGMVIYGMIYEANPFVLSLAIFAALLLTAEILVREALA